MDPYLIDSEEAKTASIDSLFQRLQSSQAGLSSAEAEKRIQTCGLNLLKEKKESLFLKFFHYFWGPIPWMIEIAAILSVILHHWPDLIIILVLLFVNGLVGFFEEFQAGNAIAALKNTKYPAYNGEKVDYKNKTDKQMQLEKVPIAVTVIKIDNNFIVDPDTEEEKVIDARLTVSSMEDGTLCALQKGGDQPLTQDEISQMLDIGIEKAKELRAYLK